ncbi:MAG TPA: acetyl-CoA carboxylase biotin carboxyl carrier protein [Bacteriovoracaceae bacterium]|nr:acetyl-CoA carboxylase biotin carboxyl carrier protein [Bacteriovoracaceae bacterium]
MNLDTLKEIVKVAKDNGVAELKVEGKDYKVSVNFTTSAAPIVHHQPAHIMSHQIPAATAAVAAASKAALIDAGLHIIKSPFVGTFYGAPSPGKPVYAKVGDKVKVGQPLCVLEAMKIMNEIDADVSGEIVEICVDNESLVEFGQPLFKIKPN